MRETSYIGWVVFTTLILRAALFRANGPWRVKETVVDTPALERAYTGVAGMGMEDAGTLDSEERSMMFHHDSICNLAHTLSGVSGWSMKPIGILARVVSR